MATESGGMAQAHLKRVKTLRERRDAVEREFHEAILEAKQSGESFRDIGKWAGLSHQRVHEIVRTLEREEAGG